ncbi:MAG: hypothetical protein HUJ26_18890 [Planctomycetaceae bacterium]|nr:hypothetical protein [Planctomycetaceae bacterium]
MTVTAGKAKLIMGKPCMDCGDGTAIFNRCDECERKLRESEILHAFALELVERYPEKRFYPSHPSCYSDICFMQTVDGGISLTLDGGGNLDITQEFDLAAPDSIDAIFSAIDSYFWQTQDRNEYTYRLRVQTKQKLFGYSVTATVKIPSSIIHGSF